MPKPPIPPEQPVEEPPPPGRDTPVIGDEDVPWAPVKVDVDDPESATPGRGEPERESDETF